MSSFTGTLQADGYAGFDQIYETGRIKEAACWAHVRRKFYDLVEAHKSQTATTALERIAELYAVEKEIRGRPCEERREIRNLRAGHCWNRSSNGWKNLGQALEEIRYSDGGSLRTGALGSAGAVL